MKKYSIPAKALEGAFAEMRGDRRKITGHGLALDRCYTEVADALIRARRTDPTISLVDLRRLLKVAADATKALNQIERVVDG